MIRDRLVLPLCLSGTQKKIDRICELFVYVKPFFLCVRILRDAIFCDKVWTCSKAYEELTLIPYARASFSSLFPLSQNFQKTKRTSFYELIDFLIQSSEVHS